MYPHMGQAPQLSSHPPSSQEGVEPLGYISGSDYVRNVYYYNFHYTGTITFKTDEAILAETTFPGHRELKCFNYQGTHYRLGDQPGKRGTKFAFCSVITTSRTSMRFPPPQRDCSSAFHDNGDLSQGHVCVPTT